MPKFNYTFWNIQLYFFKKITVWMVSFCQYWIWCI